HQYWIDERFRWYTDLGIDPENLQLREHTADELSHYSKRTVDVEFKYPWGWGELEGIANRGDFDLSQHQKFSGEDLTYFDAEAEEHYIPYVIEPAAGATRALLAFLFDAYREEEAPTAAGGTEKRTVMRLHHQLAPIKAAVLPLSRHADLVPYAKKVADSLRPGMMIDYDDAGSIGKRYRRHDEVGTPFAVTVDFDSLNDQAATVRDRDSMSQQRVSMDRLSDYLMERLKW
ncbi:MAG: His/Gly/Thr/Pro-type tRNA ligase C-terminal domain-containing protein, partial [Actinomycetota bacterium]